MEQFPRNQELLTENLDKKIESNLNRRIEISRSTFFEMKNNFWAWKDEKEIDKDNTNCFTLNLEEGDFTYDIDKIEIINIFIDFEEEDDFDSVIDYYEKLGPDWVFIGTNGNFIVMTRPFWKELPIKANEGVEFSTCISDRGGCINILKIGNLDVEIEDVSFVPDSYPGIDRELLFKEAGHPSNACLVAIKRAEFSKKEKEDDLEFEEKQSFFKRKNPDLAENTLNKEMRIALSQLEDLGYDYIFCYPSDVRRERIYRKTGLKEILPRGEACASLLGGRIRDNYFMK